MQVPVQTRIPVFDVCVNVCVCVCVQAGGFTIVHKDHQKEFPDNLFTVMMYAIK